MYIKQIIIQGFKSYKDQTVIEPFSPKTNIIVGRNGSGKSNFFGAIRFVLSDAYTQMSREERQGLLHEGSGSAVMSAYVEVIFDNSDDRFPTGNKEVVLRRTIGLKKDEYSVDRKVVTKSDVLNLLEAAGFSRSNPYYIVPQGRVTALTSMKESDRLNLLKEVAGTQVYEARRAESLKIMNDTNNKREKIDELLEYIKERLNELEEEKEELRGYQDQDRQRRCLEYAYYYREQVTIQETLEEIDNARQDGLDTTDSSRTDLLETNQAINALDAEMHKLQRQMEVLQIDRRQFEEDRRDSAKALAKAELKAKNLKDGQSSREQARAQQAAELESVKTEMEAKKKELAKVIPEYDQKKAEQDEIKRKLDTAEATRARLFAKQGHGAQFKNKQERDKFLRNEIEKLGNLIMDQKANKIDQDEAVVQMQNAIAQTEQDISDLRLKISKWDTTELAAAATDADDNLKKLNDDRKNLRREEEKLNLNISEARSKMNQAEKTLRTTMDGKVSRGLATIRRLKQERDIPGTYGTVADLLEVNEAYRIAVEQTAGARLFNYVVDNEDTAKYLLNNLQDKYGGRVTCLPLSRLRPRKANMPKAHDAVPLLSKITYDPKYEKVFQHIFGNTVVCPTLAVAGQYSRSHGVNGITPDGDTTNRRGVLSGGYVDPRSSRLQAVRAANKSRDEYEQLEAQSQAMQQQINAKDQEITGAMSELHRVKQRYIRASDGFEPAKLQLHNLVKGFERQRQELDDAIKRRDDADKTMGSLLQAREGFEAELQSDFRKSLSAAEEKQLEDLGNETQQLQKEWYVISRTRRELENRKQILENDLRQNLQLKLDELHGQAFEDSASGSTSESLKDVQRELSKAQKLAKSAEAELQDIDAKTDQLNQRMEEIVMDKATREQAQAELNARIEKQQKRVEKSLAKKSILTNQLAEVAKNIRDLGVLPDEAFDKYENMDTKRINSKLKKVNEALKKYKHVNKKAFEQYNSFTTQQDQLMKRRKELDDSQSSIEELVEHLDRRKDEAIERTFKQVSKEFSTIFSKLVPAGHGRLVIQRRTDRRQDADDSDEEARGSIENYTGVGISVSFNSKELDEQQRIQQLSGGQKSLCALCLIFALQATESSPMVIFDEVDANLDAQYRTAVASLLQSISDEVGTQFICTTFRPEIVHVADKCYGVTFRNKTSGINCYSTEEALEFVEGQARPV